MRLAMVVNAPGLQVRRALALQRHLADTFDISVVTAPGGAERRRLRQADVVYVIDPGRRGFPAAVAGRLARRPVVIEVGDPQAELYRAQGRSRLAVSAGRLVDGIVARRATGIVVRGRRLAAILRIRVPWVEIPDGVDLDLFSPERGDGVLRGTLGIPEEALVVGLAGSLEWAVGARMVYGWDVVEALARLPGTPIWALLVGGGSGVDHLRRRANELGVAGRLVLTGPVEHEDVARYLNAMDVCVSTQTNDPIGRGRTTAKLPEYLACDRYVLATAVGAAADVLPQEMLLPYAGQHDAGHPKRLAERLATLLDRRREVRRGAGTRAIAEARFGYPGLAGRLAGFLHEVA
jgi:glycosyltransferase involved in cell wall biosynthesis